MNPFDDAYVPRAAVPCNGCTLCCRADAIFLHPDKGDDPAGYETRPAINPLTGKPALMLKRRADGACIYLGETGCTIHERAPAICRDFDCRRLYLKFTRTQRRKLISDGLASDDVFAAGRARVDSLPERNGR